MALIMAVVEPTEDEQQEIDEVKMALAEAGYPDVRLWVETLTWTENTGEPVRMISVARDAAAPMALIRRAFEMRAARRGEESKVPLFPVEGWER